MLKLLLATKNAAKAKEYSLLLGEIPFEIVTLDEQGIEAEVSETGETMEQNATLKAVAYASLSNLPTLADDSGLEVDALGGEPGVLSARYAGPGASDEERIERVLQRLEGIPWERRTARFRCVIAIASPGGGVELCTGECQGIIALSPKGDNGFGYDPIFYLPEQRKTMAELSMEEKNEISHRGLAAKQARQVLEQRTIRTSLGGAQDMATKGRSKK
jgi:XTP/dITP diphosphohydrolase